MGESVCDVPDRFPGFHEYVAAPLAVTTADAPEHIEGLFTDTVGVIVTLTVNVLVWLHEALLPVTVYTVVARGESVTVAPARLPGFQANTLAPDAVITVALPEQMLAFGTLTVGVVITATVTVLNAL